MASFTNRGTKKNPSWQYTISRVVNGKQKPIRKGGFNSIQEARVAATEIESSLNKGIVPHLRPEPFDQYFNTWLDVYKPDVAGNTLTRYKNTLKTIREYFGNKPVQDINKRDYQAFLNEYAKTHAKDTTRKLNTHIRACVKDAMDEGIIFKDFTRKAVITGENKSKRPEDKHLNYFESKRLLKELNKRLENTPTHYLLLLALVTGMRFAEIVGLTRKDFDFKNNMLNIDKTWGYTNKMHQGFGPTKNEQSVRQIRVNPKTMKIFKEWFEKMPDNILKLVFYSPSSKYNVISNNDANKVLKNILKHLKIEPISIHGLRHTHASVLLYKKISTEYVAERLGHKDTVTTQQTYQHILKELREQDEKKSDKVIESMYV